VTLLFLSLPSPELAVNRVRRRVVQGGHHIPEGLIRRRFAAGIDNFRSVYAGRVDSWVLFNNAGEAPVLIEMGGWS